MSEKKGKGHFWAEWWVTCGQCGQVDPVDGGGHNHKARRSAAEAQGWRYRKDVGWACPKCVEAFKESA